MAVSRRYKLLCPVACALDRIGDRWTMLVLRDLHAGPARFSELQSGLAGIAPNLLTDRLQQLIGDGLVEKRAGRHAVVLYALTDLGRRTKPLLFELALFGSRFAPDKDSESPGNLRTLAVMLGEACQRVVPDYVDLKAELDVDKERFSLTAQDGRVEMLHAPMEAPDVTLHTAYEPMIAVTRSELPVREFIADHVRLQAHKLGRDAQLLKLLGDALAVYAG
jgi:DNA-binding HxlR family transcriptional regulator